MRYAHVCQDLQYTQRVFALQQLVFVSLQKLMYAGV